MKKTILAIVAACLMAGCGNKTEEKTTIAKGADLGWLSEMEQDGMRFYNEAGEETDCVELMKSLGCNAVRLRVWVNHKTGWCNLPDVLAQAKRVQAAGLELMVDFHYSDYWADPQQQNIPEMWGALNMDEMCIAVGAHTTEVLEALKAEGIRPRWVQIGNETTNGMLWPMGQLDREKVLEESKHGAKELSRERCQDWAQYARLSNSGYEAAKQVFPEVICIVHVDNAFIPRVNWFYRFQQEGGKWDMIGLSHYPFTQDSIAPSVMNDLCVADVEQLHEEYGCDVMITEIGTASWAPEEANECMADFRRKMDGVAGYAGVFYWEPEVYNNWRPAEYEPLGWGAYQMGAMTEEGKPSEALKILFE